MITVTDIAAKKISVNLSLRENISGIRLGVKTTGCSGMTYVVEYVDVPNTGDIRFVSNGIHIFVDPVNLVYLDGMEINWARTGLNEGFDFKNPLERDRCGCGESFRI